MVTPKGLDVIEKCFAFDAAMRSAGLPVEDTLMMRTVKELNTSHPRSYMTSPEVKNFHASFIDVPTADPKTAQFIQKHIKDSRYDTYRTDVRTVDAFTALEQSLTAYCAAQHTHPPQCSAQQRKSPIHTLAL